MRTVALAILNVVACLLLSPAVGLACGCTRANTSLKEHRAADFKRSKAVFSGRVVEIIKGSKSPYIEVRFRVERAWKGVPTAGVSIFKEDVWTSCDFHFKGGEEYLVYAYTRGDKGKLETNVCSETKLLSDAEVNLMELGEGRQIMNEVRPLSRRKKPNNGIQRTRN